MKTDLDFASDRQKCADIIVSALTTKLFDDPGFEAPEIEEQFDQIASDLFRIRCVLERNPEYVSSDGKKGSVQ
jgi:hypothetical protein